MARNALGLEFGSAAQLSKRPGSVLNCLWGDALKRSPGIIRKSRVSYPGPGFLSSATWSSLLKKHYNGLNQTKPEFMYEQAPIQCRILTKMISTITTIAYFITLKSKCNNYVITDEIMTVSTYISNHFHFEIDSERYTTITPWNLLCFMISRLKESL